MRCACVVLCLVALGCAPEQMLAGPPDAEAPADVSATDAAQDAAGDASADSSDAQAVDAGPDRPPAWCPAGFADCDGDRVSCEARLLEDIDHCGACGVRCMLGQVCANGVCRQPAADAGADAADAADACAADTQNDPANCGACGRLCGAGSPGMHLVATCAAGRCGTVCAAGFGDCNGSIADGCEVELNGPMNCGACGSRCARTQVCLVELSRAACRP